MSRLEKGALCAFVKLRKVDAVVGMERHGSQLVDHEGLLVQPDPDLSVEGGATVLEPDGNRSQEKDRVLRSEGRLLLRGGRRLVWLRIAT